MAPLANAPRCVGPTRAKLVRYSLLVRLSHPRFITRLSRRTACPDFLPSRSRRLASNSGVLAVPRQNHSCGELDMLPPPHVKVWVKQRFGGILRLALGLGLCEAGLWLSRAAERK